MLTLHPQPKRQRGNTAEVPTRTSTGFHSLNFVSIPRTGLDLVFIRSLKEEISSSSASAEKDVFAGLGWVSLETHLCWLV